MPARLARLLGALPDAITAGFFLTLWVAPLRFGPHGVRNGMLIMLVEFILVHASVILGNIALAPHRSREFRFRALGLFGLFYLLFIATWSLAFREWWPFVVFGWLLLAKLGVVLDGKQPPDERLHRMQSDWALATMVYLGGAFVTTLLPIPRLGLTPDLLSALDLPGSGLWVSKPHTVIAFGTFYFTTLALARGSGFLLWGRNLPGLKACDD